MLPLNPAVAPDTKSPRSASPPAETAQAPKKMIRSSATTIAPTEVSIAAFRLAYATIATPLYYSARRRANRRDRRNSSELAGWTGVERVHKLSANPEMGFSC